MKPRDIPRSLVRSLRLRFTEPARLGEKSRHLPNPLVVSFTSIPSRMGVVDITIRSLLDQTVRPERIVLWLEPHMEGRVPDRVGALAGERFEIRFRDGRSSHMKLVPALQEFPEHVVVTCDDDQIYPRDWLERLYREHRDHPGEVVAHECRRILYDAHGEPLAYRKWRRERPGTSHPDTLALGYGGVVYPPGSLHPDVTDEAAFMELAPRADDLWFKAMEDRQGTGVRRSASPPRKPLPVLFSQRVTLGSTNIHEDGNRNQWIRLCARYGLGPAGRAAQGHAGDPERNL